MLLAANFTLGASFLLAANLTLGASFLLNAILVLGASLALGVTFLLAANRTAGTILADATGADATSDFVVLVEADLPIKDFFVTAMVVSLRVFLI